MKTSISDILPVFPKKRRLMFKLSPFDSFEDEMARDSDRAINAPALIRGINERSYLIFSRAGTDIDLSRSCGKLCSKR